MTTKPEAVEYDAKTPMSVRVALDFAVNPRPKATLQAPADTVEELREALTVLAGEINWLRESLKLIASGSTPARFIARIALEKNQ